MGRDSDHHVCDPHGLHDADRLIFGAGDVLGAGDVDLRGASDVLGAHGCGDGRARDLFFPSVLDRGRARDYHVLHRGTDYLCGAHDLLDADDIRSTTYNVIRGAHDLRGASDVLGAGDVRVVRRISHDPVSPGAAT